MIMAGGSTVGLINDFLGSVRILSSTLAEWMEEELRELTDDRVTPAQLKVLKLVARTNARRIGDVAQFLGVSNAAASKAVERLVQRGLLRRDESPEDRRAVQLSLTPEGETLLARFERGTNRVLQEIFGDLPPERLQEVGEFLDRLSVRMVTQGAVADHLCLRCGIHFRERCILRQAVGHHCYFHLHGTVTTPSDLELQVVPEEGRPPPGGGP